MKLPTLLLLAGCALAVPTLAVIINGARTTAAPDVPLAGGSERVPVLVELFTSEASLAPTAAVLKP
jgi:hypothetical protein